MTLGRRATNDDGLAVGAYYVRTASPRNKIQVLGLTAESMAYRIVGPPADAAANPNQLTVHRPTFAQQVKGGVWTEVTS